MKTVINAATLFNANSSKQIQLLGIRWAIYHGRAIRVRVTFWQKVSATLSHLNANSCTQIVIPI